MQQMVQYNVNINCDSCPEGNESQIVDRLKSVFPVVSYRRTGNGFTMRLDANHPVADGALKDFADVVAETLTGLGIRMTSGVVRRITRRAPSASGAMGARARRRGLADGVRLASGAGSSSPVFLQGTTI